MPPFSGNPVTSLHFEKNAALFEMAGKPEIQKTGENMGIESGLQMSATEME